MLHAGGVDETLFIQILHAYSARNPVELISDDAYDVCLARMGGDTAASSEEGQLTQNSTELQHRFGAKLFVRERTGGERILVAGTKKRNLELVPLRRVFATLQELADANHHNATQLKQAVRAFHPFHTPTRRAFLVVGQNEGIGNTRGNCARVL